MNNWAPAPRQKSKNMRITGGKFRGRRLKSPPTAATRPTTDRVREAVFNVLEHGMDGFQFENARVLDLFAGTGALGLEAMSRGARFCLFIDQSATARGLIRGNAGLLDLSGSVKIWRRDATRPGRCAPMAPFNLVFADPPYGRGLGEKSLAGLIAGGWLAPDAVLVLEESDSAQVNIPEGLALADKRNYASTTIRFIKPAFP